LVDMGRSAGVGEVVQVRACRHGRRWQRGVEEAEEGGARRREDGALPRLLLLLSASSLTSLAADWGRETPTG
jgi:hypothetical protein